MTTHIPVLLKEVLSHLHLKPGQVVVDATLGGGGYTRDLLKAVLPGGIVIAIDCDVQAIWRARKRFARLDQGLKLVHGNFVDIATIVSEAGYDHVDAVVADLGVSSDQLDDPKRGLSFLKDGPLDMRLNRVKSFDSLETARCGTDDEITAEKIVNEWDEGEIVKILREYAEERFARNIARSITRARAQKPIHTTRELAKIVRESIPIRYQRGRIHPATKTFMALRMAVNKEMEALDTFLEGALETLAVGGRIAVVTFHSGEDRKVKKFFRESARGCNCPKNFPVCRCGHTQRLELLTRGSVTPKATEQDKNPRSRSGKLRVARKIV